MSTAAAEAPTRATPAPSGGAGSVFTRKYGPLPGWGWAALAGVGAIGWWWWRNKQGANAAAQDTGTAASATTGQDDSAELSTIQTELQNLQGSESQEGETTPPNSGSGGGKTGKYIRHVSTGKESFNQIAKANNTSVAHIVSVSKAGPENKDNLDKLLAWAAHPGKRRKGIVYYTHVNEVDKPR